ncbi:MAG TPA: fibronectin type III domain-containing protein, partial [Humisphaera sp.]
DPALVNGTTYYYRVAATGAVLSSLYSNVASATTAPVAPVSTTANATSSSQVTVAWSDVAGETGYSVERSADNGTTWTLAGTTGANVASLVVGNLSPNTPYAFRVRASNAAGGAYGPTATATTPDLPAAPAAPTSLTIGTVGRGRVPLAWVDVATNETGYYVERSTNGGAYTRIATLSANATAYVDTSVARRRTYSYRVQAFNAGGVSAYSNVASATTPSPAATTAVAGGKKNNDDDGWNDLLDA